MCDDESPFEDWGSSRFVSDCDGWLYAVAMGLSLSTLAVVVGALIGLALLSQN